MSEGKTKSVSLLTPGTLPQRTLTFPYDSLQIIFTRKFLPGRNYKKLISKGVKWQLKKLREREYHGAFSKDKEKLYSLLKAEVEELGKAIRMGYGVRGEAADVANYAHMIIMEDEDEG